MSGAWQKRSNEITFRIHAPILPIVDSVNVIDNISRNGETSKVYTHRNSTCVVLCVFVNSVVVVALLLLCAFLPEPRAPTQTGTARTSFSTSVTVRGVPNVLRSVDCSSIISASFTEILHARLTDDDVVSVTTTRRGDGVYIVEMVGDVVRNDLQNVDFEDKLRSMTGWTLVVESGEQRMQESDECYSYEQNVYWQGRIMQFGTSSREEAMLQCLHISECSRVTRLTSIDPWIISGLYGQYVNSSGAETYVYRNTCLLYEKV